jgi:tRNA threonylcarbamoyladenosine biosynthesis protein TsaE
MQFTFTLTTINNAAQRIWEVAKHKKVWAFYAAMGSGKTTFIHSLCDVLQVTSTVGSPTYSIINEYVSEAVGTIYHMDWYRLKDEEEALQAGVEDTLLTGNLCLVEWPEKAEALLPDDTLKIKIEIVDETTRQITLSM